MARKKFYSQPGCDGRAPKVKDTRFKRIYVHERRLLERFRKGPGYVYNPSPSLDGKSRFDTPESKASVNEWDKSYETLSRRFPELEPELYLRVLFKLLRKTDMSVPTVQQLGGIQYLDVVRDYLKNQKRDIQTEFRSEVQRANTVIVINTKGSGYPFALAVYYALLDNSLDLSPLFKYCLAQTTVNQLKERGRCDSYCEKLKQLATQWEYLAALDYTIFAADYDVIWGVTIPEDFRHRSFTILESVLGS